MHHAWGDEKYIYIYNFGKKHQEERHRWEDNNIRIILEWQRLD
jgi:hypothetical protein